MKDSCEIIKDLLPLYHDNVCSNESRNMVEKHLIECDSCKKYLDSMNSDFMKNDIERAEEQVKLDRLKGIKKKLFQKKVMISIVSALCAFVIFLGGFSLVFHYQMPIPYEDGLVGVNIADDGLLDITFNGKDYYCSYAYTKLIEKDGIEQNAAFIYYTNTIWTKYFSKPHSNETFKYSIESVFVYDVENGEIKQTNNDITAVYYLVGDYNEYINMSNEEFSEVLQEAILIWEK